MTEKERVKIDWLKGWFLIVSIFSGLVTFITIWNYVIILGFGLHPLNWISILSLGIIISLPAVCIYSWKLKENGNTIKVNGISEINNLQFGLSVAFGYGTWNFSFYYGLTDIFSNAYIEETVPIEMRDFKIGLIF